MHKINKRFLSLIFICFSSSLYCMEIFIPLALAACIKKMFDQGHQLSQSTFLISTNDNQNIRLSPKVMSHCLRLNTVLSHLYKNIFPKVLTVGCTKEEITTFSQAIENPTLINYDRDLNTIMKIAEAFGAYTLYAHCISNYLNNVDSDFDTKHIVPLLKKLTDTVDSEFILSKIVQLKNLRPQTVDIEDIYCLKGNHYLVNVDELASPIGRQYKTNINCEPYRIVNKNKETIYEFKSYNCHMNGYDNSVGDLATPYLFREKPYVIYFDENTLTKAVLYDFENKTEIITFESHEMVNKIYVSQNEQYIIVQSKNLNNIFVYNIHDIVNIQCKKIIPSNGIIIDQLTLSPDSKHLVVTEHNNNQHNALHYNLNDWDWNNENYTPYYTVISNNTTGYKQMLIHEEKIFLVHKITENLEFFDIEKNTTIIHLGEWDILQNWDRPKHSRYNKLVLYNSKYKNNDTPTLDFYTLKDGTLSLYITFTMPPIPRYGINSNHSNHIAFENKGYNTTTLIHYNDDKPVPGKNFNLPGTFININNRGWTIMMSAESTSLFNSKGKQIRKLPVNNSHLSCFFYNGIGASLCVRETKKILRLYESQDPDKCNKLYKDITCQQYALLDTFCSDDDKYRYNKNRSIQNDRLLIHMMESFSQKHKDFIHEKLKITQ